MGGRFMGLDRTAQLARHVLKTAAGGVECLVHRDMRIAVYAVHLGPLVMRLLLGALQGSVS
jgi:hypothetical protein